MSKLVAQRHWKFNPEIHCEKIKDKVSKTQPDESYTVKELMQRYLTGVPTPAVVHQPQWDPKVTFDSLDLEEISRMDMSDRSELADMLREKNRLVAEEFMRKRSAAKAEAESKKEAERRKEDARIRTTRQYETDVPDSDSDLDPAPPAKRRLQTRRDASSPE